MNYMIELPVVKKIVQLGQFLKSMEGHKSNQRMVVAIMTTVGIGSVKCLRRNTRIQYRTCMHISSLKHDLKKKILVTSQGSFPCNKLEFPFLGYVSL